MNGTSPKASGIAASQTAFATRRPPPSHVGVKSTKASRVVCERSDIRDGGDGFRSWKKHSCPSSSQRRRRW